MMNSTNLILFFAIGAVCVMQTNASWWSNVMSWFKKASSIDPSDVITIEYKDVTSDIHNENAPLEPGTFYALQSDFLSPESESYSKGSFFLEVQNQKKDGVYVYLSAYADDDYESNPVSPCTPAANDFQIAVEDYSLHISRLSGYGIYGIMAQNLLVNYLSSSQCVNAASGSSSSSSSRKLMEEGGVDSLDCGGTIVRCFAVCVRLTPERHRASSYLEMRHCCSEDDTGSGSSSSSSSSSS